MTVTSATAPQGLDTAFMGHPKPLRALFFTEMWERFSYYGIRPLLVLFMALAVTQGGFGFDKATASAIYGIFAGCLYLAAVPGGWLADNWLGQKRAVWWGSVIIASGHLCIALSALMGQVMFFIGLIFIVLGSGLFKTCISVMVGSLYSENDARRDGGFTLFYMGINLGSFLAATIVGMFKEKGMWHLGFGIGGLGMLVALLVFHFSAQKQLREFAAARNTTVQWDAPRRVVPGVGRWVGAFCVALAALVAVVATGVLPFNPVQVASSMMYVICAVVLLYFVYMFAFAGLDAAEKKRVLACFILLCAAAFFWSAFEQKPTSFNLFADTYTNRSVLGWTFPSVWYQSLNPLLILFLAPLASGLWVALARRNMEPGSMTKFALGLFLAAIGFALMIFAAQSVLATPGALASPWWMFFSILFLTLGELALSPVGLSYMTKLAPGRMQGQVMGLWFTASALGNLMAGLLGGHVSAKELATLPNLFTSVSLYLAAGGVVLLLLAKPVEAMLRRAQQASAAQEV